MFFVELYIVQCSNISNDLATYSYKMKALEVILNANLQTNTLNGIDKALEVILNTNLQTKASVIVANENIWDVKIW